MKNSLLTLASFFTFAFGFCANACPGAYIELNPTSWISAEGMYGSKGLEQSSEQLEAVIKQGNRAVFNMADKGVATHSVEYLGSVRDEGGIIQVIYLVKDLKTGTENTVILKSNYMGNGLRAKGLDSPENKLKSRKGFSSALEAGC